MMLAVSDDDGGDELGVCFGTLREKRAYTYTHTWNVWYA